jgi:hypothetical protein
MRSEVEAMKENNDDDDDDNGRKENIWNGQSNQTVDTFITSRRRKGFTL